VAEPALDLPRLRAIDGRVLELDVIRWLGPADEVDEHLLDRAPGPVLDVGCGPGRHLRALRRRGVEALGVDISTAAVTAARRRGARVLQRSIFDSLPHPGSWRSALLLDGSVGIGGDPVALLVRVGQLLHRAGCVLVEVEAPGETTESLLVRLEGGAGRWFPWARVSVDGVHGVAQRAGFAVSDAWCDGGRHFCQLERRRQPPGRRTKRR